MQQHCNVQLRRPEKERRQRNESQKVNSTIRCPHPVVRRKRRSTRLFRYSNRCFLSKHVERRVDHPWPNIQLRRPLYYCLACLQQNMEARFLFHIQSFPDLKTRRRIVSIANRYHVKRSTIEEPDRWLACQRSEQLEAAADSKTKCERCELRSEPCRNDCNKRETCRNPKQEHRRYQIRRESNFCYLIGYFSID